jgi:hypothetical protein
MELASLDATADPTREATQALAAALALLSAPREAGRRERIRDSLTQAIDHAERALAAGLASRKALLILARAHMLRAEDTLHGAGQLSLSAQRAPTPEDCDEGWQRVAGLVADTESAAQKAREAALALASLGGATAGARGAASRAEAAASAARRLVEERNHAYTFHTDPGFSFGEGWYLAAASVLAGVTIQVEPDHPATVQAEIFLRRAGLGARLVPYRPRPRANKPTTVIVARAFRADPPGAQRRLREAFLGEEPIAVEVQAWIDARMQGAPAGPKVLVWVREGAHHPGRNTVVSELVELTARAQSAGLVPVLVGDAIRGGDTPAGAIDLLFFWKDPIFRGENGRLAQLHFFEHLRAAHGVVGQLGVTTAGMDGPALMGMPTMYLTGETNPRMSAWVGAVPGYVEVVRDATYLDRVSQGLVAWREAG